VAGRFVLNGLDLDVPAGEVHAVMGPNGSGKSTFAHVLMGRPGYEQVTGSVTLNGIELLGLPAWQRARAGLFLAPQYPTEVPGVSLDGLLAAAAEGRSGIDAGSLEERVGREAERVGLATRLLDRAVNVDLSGGERKRSETVQLGVLRPQVAVLDEIDSGLDVDGMRAVARRVRAAVDEWGLSVLAITHYRRLLSELQPDVIHILVHGQIVARGGAELAEELESTGYAAYGVPT
jgi:Fe-S cluster assembly ATP-binding protein